MTGSMRHGAPKEHAGDSGRAGYGPRDGGGGIGRKKMDTSAGANIIFILISFLHFVFSVPFVLSIQ